MKKLLLLLTLTIVSLNSIGMGFPQNTYEQQRALTKNTKKMALVDEFKTLEVTLEASVINAAQEDTKTQESLVQMVADYVIRFFTEKIFDKKSMSVNTVREVRAECVAIKKDFEFCIIG
jgi:hypothetical protein